MQRSSIALIITLLESKRDEATSVELYLKHQLGLKEAHRVVDKDTVELRADLLAITKQRTSFELALKEFKVQFNIMIDENK